MKQKTLQTLVELLESGNKTNNKNNNNKNQGTKLYCDGCLFVHFSLIGAILLLFFFLLFFFKICYCVYGYIC